MLHIILTVYVVGVFAMLLLGGFLLAVDDNRQGYGTDSLNDLLYGPTYERSARSMSTTSSGLNDLLYGPTYESESDVLRQVLVVTLLWPLALTYMVAHFTKAGK